MPRRISKRIRKKRLISSWKAVCSSSLEAKIFCNDFRKREWITVIMNEVSFIGRSSKSFFKTSSEDFFWRKDFIKIFERNFQRLIFFKSFEDLWKIVNNSLLKIFRRFYEDCQKDLWRSFWESNLKSFYDLQKILPKIFRRFFKDFLIIKKGFIYLFHSIWLDLMRFHIF